MQTPTIEASLEDMRDNKNFEKLMLAFARPGDIIAMDGADIGELASCLLDRETNFYCENEKLKSELLALGSKPVNLERADYVFMPLDESSQLENIKQLHKGSLLYPENSATLIAEAHFPPLALKCGVQLKITGPGIKNYKCIAIDGVHPSFWPLRNEMIHYPLGFDLLLIDEDMLLALPRSTKIEVLSWPM